MKYTKDREIYLRQYPEVKKWLNQCVIYQEIGYKKEMPNKIGVGVLAENIRKYWNVLDVNDISICEQCSSLMN